MRERALIQEIRDEVENVSVTEDSVSKGSIIQQIPEGFSQLSRQPCTKGKPLIQELDSHDDSSPAVNKEGEQPCVAAAQESKTAGYIDNRIHTHDPSWATVQKLAEQVGSTIDREPVDVAKEKKAFVEKMENTNLGDLD